MKKLAMILLLSILLVGAQPQSPAIAQEYWPADSWRTSTPEAQGMDSAVLADMIHAIAQGGKSINSISIIKNGYLVNETYFYPYYKGLRHSLNSCTKSFLSALVGIGIEEGKINSINDKMIAYFPDLDLANVDQRKRDLTICNLLNMTTGLEWEIAGNISTGQMLQSPDWTKFTLDLPVIKEPGIAFNYCNGAAQIISSIVQKTMGKSPAALAEEKLQLLEIKDMYWMSSPENVSSGYSGIYMYPDDMAKFGYLYLRKGNWNGNQLVPEKWIEESTKLQTTADWTPLFPGYGYMWWMNRFGGYAALGFGGNYIFVVPELDLVVVFTGGLFSTDDLFYPGELMENFIVPSVKSNAPIELNQMASESLSRAVDMVQKAPSPEPVKLPEMAKQISGKPFVIGDSTVFTIWFEEGSSEFTYSINSLYSFTVGLDNVFRVMDAGNLYGLLPDHNHRALRGGWLDEKTLQIFAQDLEDGFEETITARFEKDQVELNSKSNLYPEQTGYGKFAE